jgi:hypothetical protein
MEKKPTEQESKVVYLSHEETMFSDETITALRQLGAVLEPIYRKMLESGEYVRKNGKITKKENVIYV